MSILQLLELLSDHEERRTTTINLVASENLLSPAARRALDSDFMHRYCIPPVDKRPESIWDYPNQRWVRGMQEEAERLTCELFHAEVADVRPLSGNNAAYVLLKALIGAGVHVASVPAYAGGHFATEAICVREGIVRHDLPYRSAEGILDVVGTAELCQRNPIRLIFLDASMQLFPHPVRELRAVLPEDVVIAYDASHTMGLIGGGLFQDPLREGADLLQGSTHKTLFGPQKALFAFRTQGEVSRSVRDTVSPLFVSNSHPHHTAALAVALREIADFGPAYARQVMANAQALGHVLHELGEPVLFAEAGFTRCHQVMWLGGSRVEAEERWRALEEVGIHVNLVRAPFSRGRHGFRVGVAEATRRGMREAEMAMLAEQMVHAVRGSLPASAVRATVHQLSSEFQRVCYGYDAAGQPLPDARARTGLASQVPSGIGV